MVDLRIVDIGVENPRIETEEGTIQGDSIYTMVVEAAPNFRRTVEVTSNTYKEIHALVYGN